MNMPKSGGIYVISDYRNRKTDEFLEITEKILNAGISLFQFRDKNSKYETKRMLAKKLQALCKKYKTPFIINDDVKLAKEISADGVHLGKENIDINEARNILGGKIIGASCYNDLEYAIYAEKLGANYYNTNPLYPLNQTLAVINIDGMGNTFGRTKDLIIVGKDNSNLDQIVEMAAKQDKKYILPNPEPEKGYFYRSDHFEFAKMGVPSLYVNSGVDIRGKSKKYGLEKRNEYIKQHYHALSDEIKDDWTFDGLVEDNKILLRVGYAISQHSDWPAWNEGAEFKSQRDRMMLGEE